MVNFLQTLINLTIPEKPTVQPIIETKITVNDIPFDQLIKAVQTYVKKHIAPAYTFSGVNYLNNTQIEVIATTLDHTNTRHGHGKSNEISTRFVLGLTELGF